MPWGRRRASGRRILDLWRRGILEEALRICSIRLPADLEVAHLPRDGAKLHLHHRGTDWLLAAEVARGFSWARKRWPKNIGQPSRQCCALAGLIVELQQGRNSSCHMGLQLSPHAVNHLSRRRLLLCTSEEVGDGVPATGRWRRQGPRSVA